jgi:hypothetical protein
MKKIKLNKKLLSKLPNDFLVSIGAADKEPKAGRLQLYPELVFLSKEDAKKLKQNIAKAAKKQYPGMTKNYRDRVIGMEWLNFGPNESLSEAIKPGYALIDIETIQKVNNERSSD